MQTKSKQGVFRDRYMVIPRTLIFIFRDSEVLLLKGAPDKRLWANQYNGIGGHLECGEDVLSSAKRELKEETGLVVSQLRLCGTVMVDSGEQVGIGIFVFRGNYEGGNLLASPEGSLEWVSCENLGRYPLVEDLFVILPHILAQPENSAPFSARYEYDAQEKIKVIIASP